MPRAIDIYGSGNAYCVQLYTLSTAESVDTLHFLGLASSHKSSALKSKSLTFKSKSKSFGVKSKSQKTGLESYSSPSHKSKYYISGSHALQCTVHDINDGQHFLQYIHDTWKVTTFTLKAIRHCIRIVTSCDAASIFRI
jgi:hypothetical protein